MRGIRRLSKCWALLATAVAGLVAAAPGVQAAPAAPSTITGTGGFTLAVSLEYFPCPSICSSSTMSGVFIGQLVGVDVSGLPYSVEFPDPTLVPSILGPNVSSSSMTNSDVCLQQAQTSPAILATSGTANIAFVISGGLLTRGGVTSHGAKLTGSIFWSRSATAGTIGISAPVVSDSSGGTVATGSLGAGAGSFTVPLADVSASCASQIAGVAASITGAAITFA